MIDPIAGRRLQCLFVEARQSNSVEIGGKTGLQYHVLLERVASGTAEWAVMVAPLAVYLLILAQVVYRQGRPVVLSGPANMAALWFAVSGFLLFGPPSWIVYSFSRYGPVVYGIAYGCYVLFLVLAALVTVARQRHSLVVFNLDPDRFGVLLPRILANLGIPYEAIPGRLALADGKLVLDLETSRVWSHVVVTWYGHDESLRRKIETELRACLSQEQVRPGHAQRLLMVAAMALVVFLVFAFLVVRIFHPSL